MKPVLKLSARLLSSGRLAALCTSLPLAAALLSGCGASTFSTASSAGSAITGKVFGGQQPISGAVISLYAAGVSASGPGTGASSLLASQVVTDAYGDFSITKDYICPSSSTQVYIVARGGDPGIPGFANNPASVLMAPLGDCGNLSPATSITINEVTTAASAWALAQFAPATLPSGAIFGASSTNATGLRNAFLVANNLVNVATGLPLGAGLPPGSLIEASKLNTLADILAVCVNSDGRVACGHLFAASNDGTNPTNTLDAALAIVRNPASNVAAVFNAGNAQGPFQPTLPSTPNDWTMTISYVGGGLYEPTAIGIDSTGSIWAADYLGGHASKLSAAGIPASAGGFADPRLNESYGLAIDPTDAAWITVEESPGINSGYGSITKFSSSGTLLSGNGYTAGNIYYPYSLAADSNGNIWVGDYGHPGSAATLLASDGTALSGANGYAGQIIFPLGVALDGNHNAWFAASQAAGEVAPKGGTNVFNCCRSAVGIALDPAANVWIADYTANALVELNAAGGVAQTVTGIGGLAHPQGITTDAAGHVWATNYRLNTVTGLTGGSSAAALSPSTGFGVDPGLSEPFAIAVDASGNLWVSNQDPSYSSLTEFVGLAAPTKTPRLGLPVAP